MKNISEQIEFVRKQITETESFIYTRMKNLEEERQKLDTLRAVLETLEIANSRELVD